MPAYPGGSPKKSGSIQAHNGGRLVVWERNWQAVSGKVLLVVEDVNLLFFLALRLPIRLAGVSGLSSCPPSLFLPPPFRLLRFPLFLLSTLLALGDVLSLLFAVATRAMTRILHTVSTIRAHPKVSLVETTLGHRFPACTVVLV